MQTLKSTLTLVTGFRCYMCMPKEDNPSEVLDCMQSDTRAGELQRCGRSKDGYACMLTSTGNVFKWNVLKGEFILY